MSTTIVILVNAINVCSVSAAGINGDRAAAEAALKLLTKTLASVEPTEAERIYGVYPRKVGRPVALRAIARAIAKVGFAELLNRTAAFAAAVAGKDPQFIPHPATWFNQERFADDPATWGGPRAQAKREAGATEMVRVE